MTALEMHDLADLLIDKANAPWFNADEKTRFINLAIFEFAKTRYRAFELNEKRRSDLLPLVRTVTYSNTSKINLNSISPKFMFALNLSGDFDDATCGAIKNTAVKPIQLDDYINIQGDPFNKPTDSSPIYIQRNDGTNDLIEIISETTPSKLELNYLKYPTEIFVDTGNPFNNINSDLPDYTHEEIVNLAVRKMLQNIESGLYQSQINEIENQE